MAPWLSTRLKLGLALVLVLIAFGWGVLVLGPRRASAPSVAAEWRPSVALAPGISIREGKVSGGVAWRLIDLSIDPARAELRVVGGPPGGKLEEMLPEGALAAINGGYFDEGFRPTAWLVDQGREISPKLVRTSGGVLALRSNELFVGPVSDLKFTPELAVQNSPRLIEDGGKVGIHKDDGRRASRTIACDVSGRLHLLVIAAKPNEGPTLLESARLLAERPELGGLGCDAALNLDGGPSTGMWVAPMGGIESELPRARIAYGLAILPR
jgi:hypothetical protein